MQANDTIVAVATPAGAGGVGIVRLSGSGAAAIGRRLFVPLSAAFVAFKPYTLHHGRIVDAAGEALDEALVAFMPAPKSFTGEDVVEVQCHGGQCIVHAIVEAALSLGARLAERGEFSRRALLNGRMDLTQAEAVAELIAAPSREALRYGLNKLDGLLGQRVQALHKSLELLRVQVCVAVDFPEDEVECLSREEFAAGAAAVVQGIDALLAGYTRARVFQQGAQVVLAGSVNVGKSSLMNALLGRSRALVTDIPGTTRDFLEEMLDLDGMPVRLVDTAGLRETAETVEGMGVALSRERMALADVVVLVVDGVTGADDAAAEVLAHKDSLPVVVVWNKADIARPQQPLPAWAQGAAAFVVASARSGEGIEAVAQSIRTAVLADSTHSPEALAPNARQAQALTKARAELLALDDDIQAGQAYDVCAVRLDAAAAHLAAVVGIDSPKDLLDKVFSTFCIGK